MPDFMDYNNFFEKFAKEAFSSLGGSFARISTKEIARDVLRIATMDEPQFKPIDSDLKKQLLELSNLVVMYLKTEWDLELDLNINEDLLYLTPHEFAQNSLENFSPIFSELDSIVRQVGSVSIDPAELNNFEKVIKHLSATAQPGLISLQFGLLIAALSSEVLSYFDMPLSLVPLKKIAIVVNNATKMAQDWQVDIYSAYLIVLANEMLLYLLLGSERTQNYLEVLAKEYIAEFKDTTIDVEKMGKFITGDFKLELDSLEDTGIHRSSGQEIASREMRRILTIAYGLRDFILPFLKEKLIGGQVGMLERLVMRELEFSSARALFCDLFNIRIDDNDRQLGRNFVKAIFELEGKEGVQNLINPLTDLPTEEELQNPALWIKKAKENLDEPFLF